MVHNGHIPDDVFAALAALSPRLPLLTLAPHVATYISNRTQSVPPQWVLPIYPFVPAKPCDLKDLAAVSEHEAL